MKRYIVLIIMIISIFLFGLYKVRDGLNVTGDITCDSNITADTFFGELYGIDTMIDTVPYADTAGYAFSYLNDSAYADTAGIALNAESLGGSYWNKYLTNVNDTFGILSGDSFLVSDTLHASAILPYGFGILNPACDSSFATFDTFGLSVKDYASQILPHNI